MVPVGDAHNVNAQVTRLDKTVKSLSRVDSSQDSISAEFTHQEICDFPVRVVFGWSLSLAHFAARSLAPEEYNRSSKMLMRRVFKELLCQQNAAFSVVVDGFTSHNARRSFRSRHCGLDLHGHLHVLGCRLRLKGFLTNCSL